MDFLKSTAGKVISGLVALAVIILGITFLSMNAGTRQMTFSVIGRSFGWLMVVLLVPWVTFFIISRVNEIGNNLAGGILVFLYTALEMVLLAYLFSWSIHGATQWTFFALAGLLAGVYNILACDWIAERFE